MIVLVIVLIVTNLLALAALAYVYLRPLDDRVGGSRADRAASAALDRSPRPAVVPGGTRRLISIEILNPIELAGTRGRIAGIAGSIVPGLTKRIVYDQTMKILKKELVDQRVVADVRIHTLRPVSPAVRAETTRPRREAEVRPEAAADAPAYIDDVEHVDLSKVDDEPEAG